MAKSPFWVNEVYGLGFWLKDYGFYPKRWPLYTYMDHGITFFETIPPHEINNKAPIIFKFSPRLVDAYKQVSKKPVYNIVNPTIHCRRTKNFTVSPTAKGTLFFPAHTTEAIDDHTSWDVFIANMSNIPEQFQPVDVCLHPTDIKKGLHKIFEEKGYKVFSAGDAMSIFFTVNFYNILRNYKFTMSNLLGSYMFYSVEMGIPFSKFGDEPIFNNKGDDNIEKGAYVSYKEQATYKKAAVLFNGFYNEISPAQLAFVNEELGKNHTISRIRAAFLLYKAWFRYTILSPMKNYLPGIGKKNIRSALYKIPFLKKIVHKIKSKKTYQSHSDEEWQLVNEKYITVEELARLKSPSLSDATLLEKKILKTDNFWYLHSLKEIFAGQVYRFRANSDSPRILDCGANIGLSVIYFKRLYPKAKITAFEPDKHICELLKKNLLEFDYNDVDVQEKAIWTQETTLDFSANGNLGGKLADEATTSTIKVKTSRLRDYLSQKVDFLKIDIEGPEYEVLEDCSDYLKNVDHLFVEYHSDPLKTQQLDRLLTIMKNAGFRIYIKEAWNNLPHPFMRSDYNPFFDLQLNIFASRVDSSS